MGVRPAALRKAISNQKQSGLAPGRMTGCAQALQWLHASLWFCGPAGPKQDSGPAPCSQWSAGTAAAAQQAGGPPPAPACCAPRWTAPAPPRAARAWWWRNRGAGGGKVGQPGAADGSLNVAHSASHSRRPATPSSLVSASLLLPPVCFSSPVLVADACQEVGQGGGQQLVHRVRRVQQRVAHSADHSRARLSCNGRRGSEKAAGACTVEPVRIGRLSMRPGRVVSLPTEQALPGAKPVHNSNDTSPMSPGRT